MKSVSCTPYLRALITLYFVLLIPSAGATLPSTMSYQAYVTDDTGSPINGERFVTFRLYTTESGGSLIWDEVQRLTINQGLLHAQLGVVTPLNLPDDFDTQLFLGIEMDADGEMTPRQSVTLSGYAVQALNADTLDGQDAAALDQSVHVANANNPHSVSAAQVGAVSDAELANHAGKSDAHHTKTTLFSELTGSATDAQIPNDITVDRASNTDTVDGLHASGNAAAGRLLALDGSAKFPNSVFLMGHGNGLNADMVDGQHAGSFASSLHAHHSLSAADGDPAQPLYVNDVGRVGIGTTTPERALHVVGSNPRILIEDSGTSNPEINFKSPGTGDWALYKHASSGDLRFYQSGDKITIQPDTGRVGIGTTSPDHNLHVKGLAKFELADGSIALSEPGGWPGLITYTDDGTRSDIVFDNDGIYLAKSVSFAAPSLDRGLTIHDSGRIGIGTINPGTKLEVRGEVRTTSNAGAPRLWGQGRPGTVRYGITGVESGLCPSTVGGVFGLSLIAVDWGSAAAACPEGTWVCTKSERGIFPCDTQRPDSSVDGFACDTTPSNWAPDRHWAWVADASSLSKTNGLLSAEDGGSNEGPTCDSTAVWCCSGPN